MARPKLNPPCDGWQRDLPGSNEPIEEMPILYWLAPVKLDNVYMEIQRNTLGPRGVVIWLAVLMGITTLWYTISVVADISAAIISDGDISLEIVILDLMEVALIALGIWITCFTYRADTSSPRNLPLRFNRVRRKVYVYGFHWVWWNPFVRWYVTTASYDWDDLRGAAP